MTDLQVAQMSPECQNFRKDYFAAIAVAQKTPAQLEKKLIQTLSDAKKPRSPYEATFFAMVIHTEKLKAALQKRAEIEKKLKVPFPYAEVALYRLSGKDCGSDPKYLHLIYSEMCSGNDTVLPVYFLPTPSPRTHKGKSK